MNNQEKTQAAATLGMSLTTIGMGLMFIGCISLACIAALILL